MTRPAEEPGTPLEPPGNRRPREMVTLDRIRLTGLLRKSPGNGACLLALSGSVHHLCITSSGLDGLLQCFGRRNHVGVGAQRGLLVTVSGAGCELGRGSSLCKPQGDPAMSELVRHQPV